MEQMQEAGQPEASPKLDVGATLREAREARGMSVDEVAVRIKFAPRQIESLEANRFEELPEMAFIRGFVRSYARLLQLDDAPLLAAMPGARAPAAIPARSREEQVQANVQVRNQNLIWLAGGLAIALTVIVLAWKYNAGDAMPRRVSSNTDTAAMQGATDSAAVAASQPAAEQSAVQPATATATVAPVQPPVQQVQQPPASTAKPAKQAPATTAQRAHGATSASGVAASSVVPAQHLGPSQQVRLEFDEDSWVDVTDGSGRIRLSTLGKQGTSLSAAGPTPLTVTIGHAQGVRVYYKGQLLDLGANSGKDVARLKLE